MKNMFKNRYFTKYLPMYFIILSLVILISSSYALLRSSKVGNSTYTMNVGVLEVNFVNKNSDKIEIASMYPMSDEDGLAQNKENEILEFTIKNDGDLKANYNVYIEELDSTIPMASVMKYSYSKKGSSDSNFSDYSTPVILNNNIYIEKSNVINSGETISYKVKMWLDESTDKTYMNQIFKARIIVQSKQYELNKNEIMKTISNNELIQNSSGINFNQVNGAGNGNGLFVYPGTENDEYPIYYYRGNVDNNNVYFAENCWKIVRTTETGGTKLIYNGAATIVAGEKQCLETTGTGTGLSVGTKKFNTSFNSPAYVGYSLPESSKRYSYSTQSLNSTTYYGSGVDKTTYKLVDPVLELNDTHHYSYNSTDPDATGIANDTGNVRYYYYKDSASGTSGTGYFIKFDKTKDISTILDEMLSENNSKNNPSTIQEVINTWWGSLDTTYGSYLEDTEWCNDRSIASLGGWSPTGTLYSSNWYDYSIVFNGRVRYDQGTFGSDANNIKNINTPILTCSRPVDRLTVANGNLTYPIGLLTYDEVALAGASWSNGNSNFYLYTGEHYWLLSPSYFNDNCADVGYVLSSGSLDNRYVGYTLGLGVRPALSLKHGTQILRGEGTKTKPYIITED